MKFTHLDPWRFCITLLTALDQHRRCIKTTVLSEIFGDPDEKTNKHSLFSLFLKCFLSADVCDLMWFTLIFSFGARCQLEAGPCSLCCIILTRSRLVRSAHRPTVQTTAQPSSQQTKTTGRMAVAWMVRESRGVQNNNFKH